MGMTVKDLEVVRALTFFKGFINAPSEVGSILPSSKDLANAVADAGKVRQANVVVELGPGTGAITQAIIERLAPDATFFAMETNPDFVKVLARRFPQVRVINDSAENTHHYLAEFCLDGCDSVVSGLPWASFDPELQDALLDSVCRSLKPGGRFVTYSYLTSPLTPKGRRFRRKLRNTFRISGKTPPIWANVPPAFVYYAEK